MERIKTWPVRLLLALGVIKTVRLEHHPIYLLDKWAHQFHAPRSVLNVTCEALDWWVGCYDENDAGIPPQRPLRADACDPNPENGGTDEFPETDS